MEKGVAYCNRTIECKELKRKVGWICLHPLCNNFLDMCDVCHKKHLEFHNENKLQYEADFSNAIVNFKQQKEVVETILSKVMSELTVIQEKILAEIRTLSTKENPTESLIVELVQIRNQVNELFDEVIEHIKDDSEKQISQKMKSIYEEVTVKIQEAHSYQNILNTPDVMRTVRDVSVYDFVYQTKIQRQRMEQVLDECSIKNFELVIDEDIALKLISSVRKDLNNIIQKPIMKRDQRTALKKQQIESSSTEINSWLFYFEPYSRNFHYLNVSDSSASFQTFQLEIDFVIQPGNRSILARDNQIYLVGGYDPQQVNAENEEQFKCVYKLDIERKTLQKVSTLLTLRHSFGLCQLENYLYIVGGYNYIEGSLAKCERIPLEEKEGYFNPVPINNLQKRASHLTICSWQNKIIVKYGGILLDQNTPNFQGQRGQQILVSDYLTEFYLPANDQWVQIQTLNYPCTFLSNSIEIKNEIIIFGGLSINQLDQNNPESKELVYISNNIIRMKSYKIMQLDIEISKTSNLSEHSYSFSQPVFKDSSNQKKKKVFFLGFDNTDFKNPNLKPTLKSFEVWL